MNKNKPKVKLLASVGGKFSNWIRILFANKFDIRIKFFPYVIAVAFISLFYSPFALIEKLIHDKKINKIKIKSPVFIIGHMRSGTTFLHYLLSKDEQFAWVTTTETIFPQVFLTLGKLVKLFIKFFLPNKRPMDNMPLQEDFPQEEEFAIANLIPYSPYNAVYFPKNLLEYNYKYSLFKGVNNKVIKKWEKTYIYFLKKISYKSGGKRILSKSIINSVRIKHLLKMFPDAKFIYIYRNPYETFLSSKKLYKKNVLENMAFHNITDNELENAILELAHKNFQRYFQDKHLIKDGNIIEIKYEDFVKNPTLHLKNIYKTLNLNNYENSKDHFNSLINQYKNYKPDKYKIKKQTRLKIYNKLKYVFNHFGYPKYGF